MKKTIRVAILISGRGSNMKALIEKADKSLCDVALVAADKNCPGLEWAKALGFETWVCQQDYSEEKLNAVLQANSIELICLAGFMRILTSRFIASWQNKILNIHPSLLPAFPGLHTHRRALERGVKFHGCTVHIVDEGMDTGPIIDQSVVPVFANDSEKLLAARVLEAEHELYPRVLLNYCSQL